MNIASIDSSYLSGLFPSDEHQGNTGSAPVAPQDSISLSALPDLSDDEIEGLMEETIQMISDDAVGALSVHNGLDSNRVFALLGMA